MLNKFLCLKSSDFYNLKLARLYSDTISFSFVLNNKAPLETIHFSSVFAFNVWQFQSLLIPPCVFTMIENLEIVSEDVRALVMYGSVNMCWHLFRTKLFYWRELIIDSWYSIHDLVCTRFWIRAWFITCYFWCLHFVLRRSSMCRRNIELNTNIRILNTKRKWTTWKSIFSYF